MPVVGIVERQGVVAKRFGKGELTGAVLSRFHAVNVDRTTAITTTDEYSAYRMLGKPLPHCAVNRWKQRFPATFAPTPSKASGRVSSERGTGGIGISADAAPTAMRGLRRVGAAVLDRSSRLQKHGGPLRK